VTIPLATTRITVMGNRPQLDIDPDDDAVSVPREVLANDVRASITQPASNRRIENIDETDDYALRCDLFDAGLTRFDTVIDESTGVEYEVRTASVSLPTLLGLQHIKATIRKREGLTSSAPLST
jgi:hypothetical protein